MAFDIATLNTRVGWSSTANSSLGWFRDNSKAAYRTYSLDGMSGYYWYQGNIASGGWYAYNCSGYVAYATTNCCQDSYAPGANCNCNCNSNCGTSYTGQCVNCYTPDPFNCGECLNCQSTGIQCAITQNTPAVCGQCTISGQCDTRSWLQVNCNCMQCNCACNCGQCNQCATGGPSNGNCNCQYVCNCAGTCFLPGTLVLMADGAYVPIEQIAVGAQVARGKVLGVWMPLLGDRLMVKINGLVTTPDHLFKTEHGWSAVDPRLYFDRRFGRQVICSGHAINLGAVDSVAAAVKGTHLVLHEEGSERVGAIEFFSLPADTQLYCLYTDSGEFVIAGGYIVDGIPQEKQ